MPAFPLPLFCTQGNGSKTSGASGRRGEIEGLLDQAEHADTDDAPDPQGLPEELSRRDKLRVKLDRACAELERRAQARADSERAEYERKVAARERRTGSRKGRHIKPPTEAPEAKEQINLTDADSALMRKSRRHEYRQAYNAQAAVDADGSQLVLGARVSVCASDRNYRSQSESSWIDQYHELV